MLETVRDFCASASAQSGETEQLWKSALAHLARVAQRADEGLRGRDQAAWLATLDAAHDNLRAALTWASASDPVAAMQLAGRLAWYWYLRGNYEEGSRWLEGAVARAPATTSADRLRALAGAGRLAFLSCRYERGEELLVESSRLAVELGDRPAEADIEQILASVLARARRIRDRAHASPAVPGPVAPPQRSAGGGAHPQLPHVPRLDRRGPGQPRGRRRRLA